MVMEHFTFDHNEEIRTIHIKNSGGWSRIYQVGSRSFDGRFHPKGLLPEISRRPKVSELAKEMRGAI